MNTSRVGLVRTANDRKEVPIDLRFLQLLLRAAEDPEVGVGDFALGVRVEPGVKLPRLPADDEEGEAEGDGVWRSNYASLLPMEDKVTAVLEDQASRGEVLKLSETEARERFPGLVVASLGEELRGYSSTALTAFSRTRERRCVTKNALQ